MSAGPTIYLHVGLPKTGTTFLQDLMREHADALAAEGLRYPLQGAPDHFLPALDARGNLAFAGVERPEAAGTWAALVREAAAAPDRALISHEVLATADAPHARAAVQALTRFDAHVVVTARDPARQVVADWQESVKHGRSQSFGAYLRRGGVRRSSSAAEGTRTFQAQRLPEVLRRWGAELAPDHVHVVTVPPPGSDPGLLWERFAGLLGVDDPHRFKPGSSVRRNERLGVADIELLRRVNRALRTRVDRSVRTRLTKDVYAQTVLPRVSSTAPPVLPAKLRPELDAISQQWIDDIRQHEYDVRGDLQDLMPQHVDGPAPTDWSSTELIDTSVAATAELLAEIAALTSELAELRHRRARISPRRLAGRVRRRLQRPR
jgi:hypothetical protein